MNVASNQQTEGFLKQIDSAATSNPPKAMGNPMLDYSSWSSAFALF